MLNPNKIRLIHGLTGKLTLEATPFPLPFDKNLLFQLLDEHKANAVGSFMTNLGYNAIAINTLGFKGGVKPTLIVNPQLIEISDNVWGDRATCIMEKGMVKTKLRPEYLVIKYVNYQNLPVVKRFNWKSAAVIMQVLEFAGGIHLGNQSPDPAILAKILRKNNV